MSSSDLSEFVTRMQERHAREMRESEEIQDTMTPWHENPRSIARLLRWLTFRDREPRDIPDFIEHVQDYEQDYQDMVMWSGHR